MPSTSDVWIDVDDVENIMMDQEEKVRENRLRRMAQRRGLQLLKCRRRDPRALGYGRYMLVDPERRWCLYGGHPYEYSATLDDIEAYLDADI